MPAWALLRKLDVCLFGLGSPSHLPCRHSEGCAGALVPDLGGHVASACGLCDQPPFQIAWFSDGGKTHAYLCLSRGVEVGSLGGVALQETEKSSRRTPGSCVTLAPFQAPCLPSRQVLGAELRLCFRRSLPSLCPSSASPGLESVAANDVLAGATWEVTSVIPWRGSSHINVLELAALHRQLAVSAPDSRHVILVDSQVAKSAAAKGRSTSRALSYALGRSAAIQIGFGLFFAYGFAPTCLNVADDPTRFAELRPPARLRLYEALSSQEWHALTAQRFRRPCASWLRLVLLLLCFGPGGSFAVPPRWYNACGPTGFNSGLFLSFETLRACSRPPGCAVELCCALLCCRACSHTSGFVVEPPLALCRASCLPCGIPAPVPVLPGAPGPLCCSDAGGHSFARASSHSFGLVVELPFSLAPVGATLWCAGSHSFGFVVEPLLASAHSRLPCSCVPSPAQRPSHFAWDASLAYSGSGTVEVFRVGSHSFGLVVEPALFCFCRRFCLRARSHLPGLVVELFSFCWPAAALLLVFLLFDSTLGFPGEGWFFRVWVLLAFPAMATIAPSTPADYNRAYRREPVHLVADRVVRPITRTNRARLAESFGTWLTEFCGHSLEALLASSSDPSERVAQLLVSYGQALFRAGQPYYKYSETINAVAALKPSIRRNLSLAWDLAFAWLTEEPHCHHKAIPQSILLAVLSAAISWGWLLEAAIFALAWCGLLRPGEVLQARREDLILPRDAAPSTQHALLVIRNPKTRGRAARHQSARIDPCDIVQLLDLAFGNAAPTTMLWPLSGATLRRRFEQLQARLGLKEHGRFTFDLSSFRPGGATWMLGLTENSELVRRRGRWLSLRVMDIYLQEVVAITLLPSLPADIRSLIEALAENFSGLLQRATFFESRHIPRAAWYRLLEMPS